MKFHQKKWTRCLEKVDQVLRESGLGAQRKWFFKYEITDKAIKITLEEPKKRKPKE